MELENDGLFRRWIRHIMYGDILAGSIVLRFAFVLFL